MKKKIPFDQNWCKELIVESIIDLDRNLKGGQKKILIQAYLKFGLYSYLNELLLNGEWYYISKVLYYWRELGYTPSAKIIYPYVKHENLHIRKAAMLAYISISNEGPLQILEDYGDEISPIDEMKLLDILQRKKIKMPNKLGAWLSFDNSSQLGFVLKLVTHYNALEFAEKVINLLNHPERHVRFNALDVIGKLLLTKAECKLIEMYPNEDDVSKIKIINILSQIGSKNSLDFLIGLLEMPNRSEILLAVMYSLKELDCEMFENSFDDNPKLKVAKLHVLDQYI
ncbi:HEAT repeat domain-containing protein [Belliella sp. DSM 107340]|uniref:HEAT repeat domain-containing protein n=1 Tax=Belliella calami TaxID=2923436 RepID=A0ABS9UKH8_9BACT|nr:HEAT repeat domain-containing protein [Belliella calami]MCH7397128.1 HEAT repeat domain-containing protein [Belliella calami]